MTQDGGDGTTQKFEPICIIIPKMNQIGDKIWTCHISAEMNEIKQKQYILQ